MIESISIYNKKLREYIDHANTAKVYIDSHIRPNKDTINAYVQHLQDCYECPTLGFLVKKDYYKPISLNFPRTYSRNIYILEQNTDIINMHKKLSKRLTELYPRTKYLREYITNNNRISLYYVKQIQKYSILDKFKIITKNLIKGIKK